MSENNKELKQLSEYCPCTEMTDRDQYIDRLEDILRANDIDPDELVEKCPECDKFVFDYQEVYTSRDGARYHLDGCYDEFLRRFRPDLPEIAEELRKDAMVSTKAEKATILFHHFDENTDEIVMRVSVTRGCSCDHYLTYIKRIGGK